MKVLAEFHHTDLYRGLQFLFEKRFGAELYRPGGREWADRGYFHHPIAEEMYGVLTPQSEFNPAKHKTVFDAPEDGVLWKSRDQDTVLYRFLPLERAKEMDLILCTQERSEHGFARLHREMGLKCPRWRYVGNGGEQVDLGTFDVLLSAVLEHYQRFIATNLKRGLLYHPEFEIDRGMYCWTPLPECPQPRMRTFLNFIHHHVGPGTPNETWKRYCRYADEIGCLKFMHGLGTPPPGVEVPLDKIIDESFRAMGREDLLDRSKWPDLRYNQGEPPNHRMLSTLMKESNIICHPKPSPPEGYGIVIHQIAACGRPVIVPSWYRQLSASLFLEHRQTCLYISGEDEYDRAEFRWAMRPENNAKMAPEIRRRFDENVSFADEANRIRALL